MYTNIFDLKIRQHLFQFFSLFSLFFFAIFITISGSGPSNKSVNSSSSVVINEILANDPDNGNDWLELFVVEGQVNLGDYSIVDDNTDHVPVTLPEITLEAGDYLVIEAIGIDGEIPSDGYYVTFALGSNDSLTLYKDEILMEVLQWNEDDLTKGFSYGRLPDGTGDICLLTPTKGAANQEALVTDLKINEAVASDINGNSDWFELYNSGVTDIFLGDYSIVDDNTDHVPVTLPDITLEAGDYLVIEAIGIDGEIPSDGYYVTFALGSNDSLTLYKDEILVDIILWDESDVRVFYSYGRLPDGAGTARILRPTREAENLEAEVGPLHINEIITSEITGGADWFELYNSGVTDIFLGDYSVVDDNKDHVP